MSDRYASLCAMMMMIADTQLEHQLRLPISSEMMGQTSDERWSVVGAVQAAAAAFANCKHTASEQTTTTTTAQELQRPSLVTTTPSRK